MDFQKEVNRFGVERDEEWGRWMKEIPSLNFKEGWDVKIIPPFAGAMVRFHIDKGDKHVSVYLDCHDRLGCVGSPYWEIYPYQEDTYRCGINDTEELLGIISEALNAE